MLNLNLLPVLLAIYETGHVGQAAARLKMSQPGVSTALARARKALNDPLFVRTAGGMEATARLRNVVEPIRSVLNTIDKKIAAAPTFAPADYHGEFCVAMSDVGEATYLAALLHSFARNVPNATLRSVSLPPNDLAKAMEDATVDLAIGYFPDVKSTEFYQTVIDTYTFACIMRKDHPIKSEAVTLQEFKKYGHAVPQSRSRSQELFEQYLKAKRIERHVTLRTEHFLSIPMIIANTDLLAIVPLGLPDNASIGLPQAITQASNIRVAKTAFSLPKIATKMHWHRSMHRDPRNQWLRRTIIEDLRSLRSG